MPSLHHDPDFRLEEPRLGTLTLAEIGHDPPGPEPGLSPDQRRDRHRNQLSDQRRDQNLAQSRDQRREQPWGQLQGERRDDRVLPETTGSGFGPRRLVDLLGMTLACLLIWVVYRGFTALPPVPDQSPWNLLGSARPGEEAATLTTTAQGTRKSLPPIGQFDFGQTTPITTTNLPVLAEREPVELYRSIYELEDSFEARYQPPPGCANQETNTSLDMTDCINHRLNARRAFLASNGRTMTPDKPDKGLREGPIKNHWEADSDSWR